MYMHACMHTKLLQSCLSLCDPMDYSPPGSSIYGILQARILEWVAVSFSMSKHKRMQMSGNSVKRKIEPRQAPLLR